MRRYLVVVLVFSFAIALPAAKTLDVYVVDADGGKAMLVVTPSGQSIVMDAGYAGYIDIEYEGNRLSERDGIRATKVLLERIISGT